MIIPIGDDNRDRKIVPVINYILIGLNVFVFIFLQNLGANYHFTLAYATVPAEIITGKDIVTEDRVVQEPGSTGRYIVPGLQETPFSVYLTLITSLFLHGSALHLIGNMLFLFIFGDNLEDILGHSRYFIFYLVCGVLASLAHIYTALLFNNNLRIPSLGASGAISGILGGYLLLFPHRRVTVLILRFFTQVPALVAIGIWFVFQLISGLGMLPAGPEAGGVAYGAHIGGFIAGFILIKLFALGR
jgi:membrane associated rhomboid family serine protease